MNPDFPPKPASRRAGITLIAMLTMAACTCCTFTAIIGLWFLNLFK